MHMLVLSTLDEANNMCANNLHILNAQYIVISLLLVNSVFLYAWNSTTSYECEPVPVPQHKQKQVHQAEYKSKNTTSALNNFKSTVITSSSRPNAVDDRDRTLQSHSNPMCYPVATFNTIQSQHDVIVVSVEVSVQFLEFYIFDVVLIIFFFFS